MDDKRGYATNQEVEMTEAKAEKKKSQRWNDIDGVKEEGTHYGIKDHLFICYPFIYAIFIFLFRYIPQAYIVT